MRWGSAQVGGWGGLTDKIEASKLGDQALNAWHGTAVGNASGAFGNWIAIVFGLGFVLSFGYWTTNFAEVQRALSAKSMNSARLTPIIGAWPKLLIPFVIIVPGLIASVLVRGIGADSGDLTYNNAIPQLMNQLLPTPADSSSDDTKSSWGSQSPLAPSVLIRLSDRAAEENNGLQGRAPVTEQRSYYVD